MRGDITNPDFPLNYASEMEIFNIQYTIFHYDPNIAFLQEKISGSIFKDKSIKSVKIFDKINYSVVGVIKTDHRLVNVFDNKMLLVTNSNFYDERTYVVLNIPKLYLDSRVGSDAFCKLNPLKESNLLLSPSYSLPCGNLACLDCITHHFNLFKRSFKCEKCNREHKCLKEREQTYFPKFTDFFNQDFINNIIMENKIFISEIGKFLIQLIYYFYSDLNSWEKEFDSFDKAFEYIEHEIDVRIESLKIELDLTEDILISKINEVILINSLKQEETISTVNSMPQKFLLCDENDKHLKCNIGFISIQLNKTDVNYLIDDNDESIEYFFEKICKHLGHGIKGN